jgi:uncharacterized coiled-coil DUF342 family protein
MLNETEINSLMTEMNSLKSEIKDIKAKIYVADRKKEEIFREKRKISSDIFSRIKDAKGYKDKRNSLTGVVKNTKLSKEEIEVKVKELDEEVRKLKEDKHKILTKLGVEDPLRLKRNIKGLEFKIETEGLSFEKEKELMKVLSKMKKQYDSSKSASELDRKIVHNIRELRELRQQLDMTKKIVQHSAKESQKHHIELIESSKEIDDLKKKEQEFEEKIGRFKEEIHELDSEINKRGSKIDEIKKVLHENHVQLKEDVDKSNAQILKQKDEEVQEKLKTGKKLTTEDLLIFQRTMR